MDITPLLKLMVEKEASDLFFSVGATVHMKIEGVITSVSKVPLKPEQIKEGIYGLISDKQAQDFETNLELNFALYRPELGRFRFNVFRQRGEIAVVVRYIKSDIPSIDSLGLPPILKEVVIEQRGLVIIVGATGSGKSTSLAAMIEHRNLNNAGHILTIEDPIEFVHEHKQSIVDQREVGMDTLSYDNALKNAMREAPDVILIGEIREQSTMKHAIAYSETGHLCLSTLHSNNANQALDRIINFFPEQARKQILLDLSFNLKAIISQRLIPGVNSKRVVAVEVLLNTPHIADLIEKGKIDEIKEAMERAQEDASGMQTFDFALYNLYKSGQISKENALKYADSKNNLSLKIRTTEERDFDGNSDLSIEE